MILDIFNKTAKYLLLFLILFVGSCENNKFSPFDVNFDSPYLHSLEILYDKIDTDTIKINNQFSINDTISIKNVIRAKISVQNGSADLKLVKFSVIKQSDNSIYHEGTLSYLKDTSENNITFKIYTGITNFIIQRKIVGSFLIKVVAVSHGNIYSNTLFKSFEIIRNGQPPVISNLNAPDTVVLPTSGQKVILISVKATDPNNDIVEVYFKSLDSSDPNRKFFLYDNGNITANGDSTANDGIFSILISLPYNMTPKAYRFEFEAKDYTALLSNKILHTLNVVK